MLAEKTLKTLSKLSKVSAALGASESSFHFFQTTNITAWPISVVYFLKIDNIYDPKSLYSFSGSISL